VRTLFLLFDSLNTHSLSCYGGTLQTPYFDKLAQRGHVRQHGAVHRGRFAS